MFMNRRFSPGYPPLLLTANRESLVAVIIALLLVSGCGEEIIDNPLSGSVDEGGKTEKVESISTPYYPMAVGSRWVYRNPDGSEWAREVTKTEEVGSHRYHFFSYDISIDDNQLDPSEAPMYAPPPYVTTLDRLILKIELSDINDAVQQTISLSGRVPPNRWVINGKCRTDERPMCRIVKQETIYRDGKARQEINDDALMYLYFYDARVDWSSELTTLRFPFVPYRRWRAINLRLIGTKYRPPVWDVDGVGENHTFEANVTISGIAGQPESVVTPAGAFEDCLKIQYEMTRLFFETTEFSSAPLVFEQKKLDLYETELRKELTTLFRDGLPRMQLGAVWLAPGVGPVKIERADGIAELIDYEVKAVASGQ